MSNKRLVVLFFLLIIYLSSIGVDPILGDSLVFTVTAAQQFDLATNATNHFLYVNFLALIYKLFPGFNAHYIFAVFSSICSVTALYFMAKWLDLQELKEKTTNLVLLLFGLSFTFWRISVITEVYSFYLLFVSIFLYKSLLYQLRRKTADAYASAIVFGLLFLIHIQTILLVPFYLYFLYCNFRQDWRKVIILLVLPAAVASILIIPVVFGDQSFMAILTDDAWGKSFFSLDIIQSLKSLIRNTGFLVYNFLFVLFFIVIGIKNVRNKWSTTIVMVPYLFFILKHDVSDSYVFHLVPYLFILPAAGRGFEKFNKFNKGYLVLLMPLIYLICWQTVEQTSIGKSINQKTGFKGGTKYLLFPSLHGNPGLEEFTRAYENGELNDTLLYERQYRYAKQWLTLKEKK